MLEYALESNARHTSLGLIPTEHSGHASGLTNTIMCSECIEI